MADREYARTLQREKVFLPELAKDDGTIKDTKFVECTIFGPAIISPQEGCSFEGNHTLRAKSIPDMPSASASVDAYIWVRDEGPMVGCIALFNCRFVVCTFDGIGWVGTEAYAQKLRDADSLGHWSEEMGW